MFKQKSTEGLNKIWLSPPHMGGSELKYILNAFQENWIAPVGPNIVGFETDLENYLQNNSNVAALTTGTAAIHLALINCNVKRGDEVICQSFTFSASANPIIYQGASPVFVDSEPDTCNMCPESLEMAILDRLHKGKKIKAIVVVHLYGMPAKIEEILRIANYYNIPVIEDAAEALGSSYKGIKCGTFGAYGVLSFNGNKIITTSGGGALVCKTEEEKAKTVFLSTQARDDAPHYQHSQIGYNYRMSNITAGIGRGQMEVIQQRIIARRNIHSFYIDLFKDIEGVTILKEPSDDFISNHWLSIILIDNEITGVSSEQLRLAFLENNIEARPLWKPMHLQPIFKDTPYYGGSVAESLFERGLCLPSGSNLTEEECGRIQKVIHNIFQKSRQEIVKEHK